ncbi:MAG: hypothetical protein OEM38_11290 [Gammaproteobacteria bacterium]|nr:hypothetical protein [Gammaproteobacteria bacterium]
MNSLPSEKNNFQKAKNRRVHHWHRNIGMTILLVVCMLAISGMALNHNDDLMLNKKFVKLDWILSIYGISAPENISTYSLDGNWVYEIDSTLYFNDSKIQHDGGGLVAAGKFSELNVIVLQNDILLLNNEAELIDKLSDTTDALHNILAAGIIDNNFIIKTPRETLQTDADFYEWTPSPIQSFSWLSPQTTPAEVRIQINNNYRGNGLSYERVLLDLHSGRIFGNAGVYIVDLSSIGLLVMCLSGVLMRVKQKGRVKHTKNGQQSVVDI